MKRTTVECDRCGKDIDARNIVEDSAKIDMWGVKQTRTGHPQRIDLCPSCYDGFVNWLEQGVKQC